MAMVDNLIRVPCMCKRMKIDNRDGIFPSHSRGNGSQVQARQGKASQRGRAAPRFRDRWIQPTLHVHTKHPPPPPHVSVPRLCILELRILGSLDAHSQSVTHYILHVGSSSWLSPSSSPPTSSSSSSSTPLSSFSLTRLFLACRASPKLARVVKPPPLLFHPSQPLSDSRDVNHGPRKRWYLHTAQPQDFANDTYYTEPTWHRTRYCARN